MTSYYLSLILTLILLILLAIVMYVLAAVAVMLFAVVLGTLMWLLINGIVAITVVLGALVGLPRRMLRNQPITAITHNG